jgi:hypothetical protein
MYIYVFMSKLNVYVLTVHVNMHIYYVHVHVHMHIYVCAAHAGVRKLKCTCVFSVLKFSPRAAAVSEMWPEAVHVQLKAHQAKHARDHEIQFNLLQLRIRNCCTCACACKIYIS